MKFSGFLMPEIKGLGPCNVRRCLFYNASLAKLLQSCLTLCYPIDSSPPGSPVPGILLEKTLEWVAISLPNAWKWKVKGKLLSLIRLFATPWTAAYQAPPSMGFSRQEYWSGVPSPSLNAIVFHNLSISYKWYDTHTWWIQECAHFKSLTRL